MIRDPRGGHNRYKVNEDFFKTWSPEMAYVLGYIYADGALLDSRKASRTQYLAITSKEPLILRKIRKVLETNKPLRKEERRTEWKSKGRVYFSRTYTLRIGNKIMFNDLLKLGLTPRKSLTLTFPNVPVEYLNHFIRGYFDGDGCLHIRRPHDRKAFIVRLYFCSGRKQFLTQLSNVLFETTGVEKKPIKRWSDANFITYGKLEGLKILGFLYKDTEKNKLYLEKKHKRYLVLLKEKSDSTKQRFYPASQPPST